MTQKHNKTFVKETLFLKQISKLERTVCLIERVLGLDETTTKEVKEELFKQILLLLQNN